MIIVPKFELKYNRETGIYTIISITACTCPLCGGSLYHRDYKPRNSKKCDGEILHFKLRRLLCDNCKKLHTEIPDIIQPHKHYDSATIQSVIDGTEESKNCVADNSTIRRWEKSFAEAASDIDRRLISVQAKETDSSVRIIFPEITIAAIKATVNRWLAFVMYLLINSGHKLCTRFAFRPPHYSDTIQSASKNNDERDIENVKTFKDTG